MPPAPLRMLPKLTDDNRDFWTSGADGQLRVPRCSECRRWVLPPTSTCAACGGDAIPTPVSGRATLFTWTSSEHQFHPDVPVPYLIAIVVLDEQEDLRLATNLVGCEESELTCGMPLQVTFEPQGEIYYPLFTPAA